MDSSELSQLKIDKRNLYCWLLGIFAALLLVLGLCAGLIVVGQKPGTYARVLDWASGVTINLGAGVVIVLLTMLAIRAFHIPEKDETGTLLLLQSSGIEHIYQNWIRDKPANDRLYHLFSEARVINIIGVTLSNTLISAEWFAPLLAARIRDPEKTTQILMLDPTGNEVGQTDHGWTRDVGTRAAMSAAQIDEGFRLAQCAQENHSKFLKLFDYHPSCNYIRFDDTAFVVLLMHGQGGQAPGLQLRASGWLFDVYKSHFELMWERSRNQKAQIGTATH